jgi:hypothetical protein
MVATEFARLQPNRDALGPDEDTPEVERNTDTRCGHRRDPGSVGAYSNRNNQSPLRVISWQD